MKERSAGILLSVTALPSRHGIGDFGKSSREFIDHLSRMGFKVWQILPLNPLGYGNSPYQPFSSFAIDEQFVDLDALTKEGLIGKTPDFNADAPKVHYDAVKAFKFPYLKQAFEKYLELHGEKEISAFRASHPWVEDWSVFMTFKRRYPSSWNEWPKEVQEWIKTRPALSKEDKHACLFEIWLQMVLYAQWDEVHQYAKKKGIKIIGDIPFYVGFDSCDVWANQDTFLLDKDTHLPSVVAGVPRIISPRSASVGATPSTIGRNSRPTALISSSTASTSTPSSTISSASTISAPSIPIGRSPLPVRPRSMVSGRNPRDTSSSTPCSENTPILRSSPRTSVTSAMRSLSSATITTSRA